MAKNKEENSLSKAVTRRIDNLASSEIVEWLVEHGLYDKQFFLFDGIIYITQKGIVEYYSSSNSTIKSIRTKFIDTLEQYGVKTLSGNELKNGRSIFWPTVSKDASILNIYTLRAFLFIATKLNTPKAEQVLDFLINAGEAKLSDIYEAPTLEDRLSTEIALKQEADIIGIGDIAKGMTIHNHGTINFIFNTTTAEHIGNIIDNSKADADTKRLLKDTIREIELEKEFSKRSILVSQAWEIIGRTADLSTVIPIFTTLITKLFS